MDDHSIGRTEEVTTPTPDARTLPSDPTWPDFFPEGCPPAEAMPATGVVLRVVASDPPTAQDFIAWCVEHGGLSKNQPCKSCGVSVFDDMDDVRHLQRRVPAYRDRPIAKGDLQESMGVTKPTPSSARRSHRSWWLPDGIDPSSAFRVIEPSAAEEIS